MSAIVVMLPYGCITFSDLGSPETLQLFVALLNRLPQDVLERLRDECDGIAERFVLDELWKRHHAH